MSYIITKSVGNFTYYLGKFGRWEGLITNARIFKDIEVLPIINNLKARNPDDKFSYKEYKNN